MRRRRILRKGDSGTKTSPPIHLGVRAPKGVAEPVDILEFGISGSSKALPGRQERRAIMRQERPGSRDHVVPRHPDNAVTSGRVHQMVRSQDWASPGSAFKPPYLKIKCSRANIGS